MDTRVPIDKSRRPVIDLLRGVALLIVVTGHLTLAVIDKADGSVRGTNLLELFPRWSWVTIVAPMPLFFVAGGYANAESTFAESVRRLSTFAALATVVVTTWAIPVVVADVVAGSTGLVGDGARLATQPLWFFAAYAPLAAMCGPLRRLSPRALLWLVGACIAVVLACDVVRFGADGPEWIGWIGFLPAYGSFWIGGIWWRRMSAQSRINERGIGVVLSVVSVVVAFLLTRRMGYSWALIDAAPGHRSNTTPPTIFTVTAGFLQSAAVLTFASALDSVARRREAFFAKLRDVAVGVYVWHLSAMMIVSSVFALGLPLANRFTTWWWVSRPLWYGAIGLATSGLVVVTRLIITRMRAGSSSDHSGPSAVVAGVVGVLVLAGAAAFIGLKGPRMSPAAVVLVIALAGSWRALDRGGR